MKRLDCLATAVCIAWAAVAFLRHVIIGGRDAADIQSIPLESFDMKFRESLKHR